MTLSNIIEQFHTFLEPLLYGQLKGPFHSNELVVELLKPLLSFFPFEKL